MRRVLAGQEGGDVTPLPYTASPLKLLWSDISLFVRSAWALPGILLPLRLAGTNSLDEFYPSFPDGADVAVHVFLVFYQLLFLLSLPIAILFLVPTLWILTYAAVAILINSAICFLTLNGWQRFLVSRVPVVERPGHEREHWIFVNGVAVGKHWLQKNIDQLSYTFGRKITGVHNPTSGIVFDVLQCLIQRDFGYATQDVRDGYVLVKKSLLDPQYEKIVLILHSQGGIEGGLMIDWLLDELPQNLLNQMEVYTFGNAANHFNNPCQSPSTQQTKLSASESTGSFDRSISHIEHYANTGDFVSIWGVLHFVNIPNRYLGRLFVRPGSGHLMNQHYLDYMFTLGPDRKVLESNSFMDMAVEEDSSTRSGRTRAMPESANPEPGCVQDEALLPTQASPPNGTGRVLRVKDFSRLWLYRNGGSPSDKNHSGPK